MVGMTLMGVVGAVFTTGIVQVYRTTNTVETMARVQSQVQLVLQRLDTEIRYAYDITTPTTPEEAVTDSGVWYVEFLLVDSTGTQQCDQLKLGNGVLSQRSWAAGSAPATPVTALASGIDMSGYATVSSAAAVMPFQLRAAGTAATATPTASAAIGGSFSPNFQRLRLQFVTAAGTQRMPTDITFTALNTTLTTSSSSSHPTAALCETEGRP
jgi:hypothetical protein